MKSRPSAASAGWSVCSALIFVSMSRRPAESSSTGVTGVVGCSPRMASTCSSIVANVARSAGLGECAPGPTEADAGNGVAIEAGAAMEAGAAIDAPGGDTAELTADPQADAATANPSSSPTRDRRRKRELISAFWHDRTSGRTPSRRRTTAGTCRGRKWPPRVGWLPVRGVSRPLVDRHASCYVSDHFIAVS